VKSLDFGKGVGTDASECLLTAAAACLDVCKIIWYVKQTVVYMSMCCDVLCYAVLVQVMRIPTGYSA